MQHSIKSSSSTCSLKFEKQAWDKGFSWIAGIDEVGRGALFGPVCAAAVVLNPNNIPYGIKDSKKLTAQKRLNLSKEIRSAAHDWAVAFIDSSTIDQINILEATRKAMYLAINKLKIKPDYLLCDAMELESIKIPQKSIVKGDIQSISIAAASIIAKVERDHLVINLDIEFPGYDLKNNMGYGTKKHLESLRKLGPTDLHRHSFRGV
ncbi:MAG: ribonuclease HII [Acidobacteriia bacterium]|nr:ribonuclease HII [Terriglobia bacterium]